MYRAGNAECFAMKHRGVFCVFILFFLGSAVGRRPLWQNENLRLYTQIFIPQPGLEACKFSTLCLLRVCLHVKMTQEMCGKSEVLYVTDTGTEFKLLL